MDLISIIVPIYKVEKYLDRCIRSIVEQSYQNLEIILVDDGSTDNCPAICDAWAEKDNRIKVVHKENGGLSDARNAGLAVATGEFISFIDSDDYVAPEFICVLYEALINTGAEIVECATDYMDEDDHILRHRPAANTRQMGRIEALRRLVLEDGVYQTVWNKLYRRDVIAEILFEKGKYNEDEFWTYLIFDHIETLAVVQQPLYYYLQRGSSIIGTGYNIRRLDGVEARFLRMQYLQKYEELACLTRQQFAFDCLWHLQCVLRHLKDTQQMKAKRDILVMLERTARVSQKKLKLNLKYRVWYEMLQIMPETTAKIRNSLKIGL